MLLLIFLSAKNSQATSKPQALAFLSFSLVPRSFTAFQTRLGAIEKWTTGTISSDVKLDVSNC